MRLGERWLDEQRGLRWVVWGSLIFMPSLAYLLVTFVVSEPGSGWWEGIRFAAYGAFIGAVLGLTGWIRLLISRLLRIRRQ
ncbi:hypothetical protein GH975_04910 [Litorivicinus lipolyticus]|uniref:Uncharacterized protein n=1 Tax=Litorivicinus lipolyticus TaxID=418701 RepID=A0A5Q2QAB9_9GAMM|nr:hypothetical protein [Litorivicinus lipolyticus]QGG79954.1 hypothetical protein GH975_04910 [Litorivicinus lipolyticus]